MSQEKFQQALSLFKSGNRKQAGELLLEVVKSEPGNADAWYGLASCTDVVETKKFYLQKVLEINPQHTKVLQLLEKIEAESRTNSVVDNAVNANNKEKGGSTASITSFVITGILVLCVAWLFYKVNVLEKSLVQTQNALASTIDTLSYVEAIAKNADNYAHSHNNFSDSRLNV